MINDIIGSTLSEMISRYGVSVCENPQRCAALLRDLCPENRREVNVLTDALREGVPAALLRNSQGVPVEALIGNQFASPSRKHRVKKKTYAIQSHET